MAASPAERIPERYSRRTVEVRDAHAELLADFRAGMLEPPRSLPPKYFYDARGSALFDAICDTPEYYPTRLEASLLERNAEAIITAAGASTLVELGSGTSRKTEYLLAPLERAAGEQAHYVANDVCPEILDEAGARLVERFPQLSIRALAGDYNAALEALAGDEAASGQGEARLFTFLGSSLGNFEDAEAIALLQAIRRTMGPEDHLLLGLDRVKPVNVLEAAYDDAGGVTAAFNLNLLSVLNRELGADFDPRGFVHRAPFNPGDSRIEMHLVAQAPQRVRVDAFDTTLDLTAGEVIRTEISRKFDTTMIDRLLAGSGLLRDREWLAGDGWYSLLMLRPDPEA